jgi:UDP-N-acetylglucosamine 1-carboxyvinyltransferase
MLLICAILKSSWKKPVKALRIHGGIPLKGTVAISGAKNAALPLLIASLLTRERMRFFRVPNLGDVHSLIKLLNFLGARVEFDGGCAEVIPPDEPEPFAPYELVRTMRASFLVLGPLLSRCGYARVSLPGGCAIGARPVDQHLKALSILGAEITLSEGYVCARLKAPLKGTFVFDLPTVGGTENLLMAAALSPERVVLENAACEPEVVALAELLNAMGAEITGAGTPRIQIRGNPELRGTSFTVPPDRIEAGTYLLAGAATRGEIEVLDAEPDHLSALLVKLRETGVVVEVEGDRIYLKARDPLRPREISTAPYPGFPTDLQAQWLAFMLTVPGVCTITETIFENRFLHVPELMRMGAEIYLDGPRATVIGGKPLNGATVMATDLRASAGLVIAGLCAQGRTEILRLYHLERGYERLDEKLKKLGAEVEVFHRDATLPQLEEVRV